MPAAIPATEANSISAGFDPTAMGYASTAISGGGFETFCLETNACFNPGSTYYYGISQGASNGGVSGGNPDPISLGTAWLYLHFAQGTLAGYDYTPAASGNASAAALQATIWWLEGDGANPRNAFSTLVMALPNYSDNNDGYSGVGVLNLWGHANHTQGAQDQLILLPVPEGDRLPYCSVSLGRALHGWPEAPAAKLTTNNPWQSVRLSVFADAAGPCSIGCKNFRRSAASFVVI